MRTVLVLAIVVTACMCSYDSSEMEIEEDGCKSMASPDVSSSQSNPQRPDENQGGVGGSPKWGEMTPDQEKAYLLWLERFKSDEEGELQGIGERFKEREETFGRALDKTWPLVFVVLDRKTWLERSFYRVLCPGLSFPFDKEVAKRIYADITAPGVVQRIEDETIEKAIKGLQEIHKELEWDRDDQKDTSELTSTDQEDFLPKTPPPSPSSSSVA
jgi:hypothetical protein